MKVIICGAGGRMGQTILKVIPAFPELEVVGCVEREGHPLIGKQVAGKEVVSSLEKVIHQAEVVIEFTEPPATLKHIPIMIRNKKKWVIGTTGFTPKEVEDIKKASQSIPILMAPNMSMGMNLLFNLGEKIARVLDKSYEVEIIEMHHHYKKDAPSGSALKLGEKIASARGRKLEEVVVYGRKGQVGPRREEEIGIHAVRGGGVIGEHRVIFACEGERIELIHVAESREAFARGALKGALWLKDKEEGLYSMEDVLGI